eukprot:3513717-Heterocapsa_arctica.AAC.1
MTLKRLGAVYNASCTGKFKDWTPTEVISEAWPWMLATRMPVKSGSTEDHANRAWVEAAKCAKTEGLNKLKETSLPYK